MLTRLRVRVTSRPLHSLIVAIALTSALYVIAYPFSVVTYPPLTDMPFHASAMTIMRHYYHASWHFREQFTLHPLAAPYLSFYVLGALLSVIMPIETAASVAAGVMLAMLPIGLAVFFHGMKKSPLWGLLGLGLVWSNLTHWGFLNFMGAVGMYAMAIGFTLMVVDRPTRRRQVLLAVSLAAIFFTHVFRFPFALLSVVGTAVIMYPATRRIRPIVAPLVPNLVGFALWESLANSAYQTRIGSLALDWTHLEKVGEHLVGGFKGTTGDHEMELFVRMAEVAAALALVTTIAFFAAGRASHRTKRQRYWGIGVTVLPLLLAGGFFLTYLALPYSIGDWWYVYPRELTPAVFIALGALPDMPRVSYGRLPIVLAICFVTAHVAYFVADQFDRFEAVTSDFRAILPKVSRGKKLLYLVFDNSGVDAAHSRFVHLPAWVQADRGGWLSFQFVSWNFSPIRYREGGVVPPKVPDRWEWEPEQFRVLEHGAWFDEFLVRSVDNPTWRFMADPSLRFIAREGTWWLYRRR